METPEFSLTPPKPHNRRRRVVLADPAQRKPSVETIGDLAEQTTVGAQLVRELTKAQLRTTLAFGIGTFAVFVALPIAFYAFPALSEAEFWGIRIPWLLLGLAPFPLCYAIGYSYRAVAERHERDFVNMVEN